MAKYILTTQTKECNGKTLYRIQATKDFCYVKTGQLGGYIEKEENLSQYGDCWVHHDACLNDNAYVDGNSIICDNAKVHGNARVHNSYVGGFSSIGEDVVLVDKVCVMENSQLFGQAKLYSGVIVTNNAKVYGHAAIYGDVRIKDNCEVFGDAIINDNAVICQNAKVTGGIITNSAHIGGNVVIRKDAYIFGDAYIQKSSDILNIEYIGENDAILFFKTKGNNICVTCNGYHLYLKDFESILMDEFPASSIEEYKLAIQFAKQIMNYDIICM